MLKAFQIFLEKHFPNSESRVCVLAMSGGVDSVVLGHLLLQCRIPFSMAHCNFQLRDAESDRDEAFVKTLADDWKVTLHVKHFDTKTFAEEQGCSIQVAARTLRYQWFHALLGADSSATWLATAHHANDSVETMLMNLMRGTGIEGLHGILPKRDRVIRPLLFATKQEILAYANENNLIWVEDSSNESNKYTRNFIRNEMMPAAEKIFPSALKNMMGTIDKMQEAEQLYMQAIVLHKRKLLKELKGEWQIPVLLLLKVQPLRTITWELIKPFGFSEGQVDEVIKLCKADSGAYVQASDWRIIRHRKWLLIAPIQTAQASHILIEGNHGEAIMKHGVFYWKMGEGVSTEKLKQLTSNEAVLDAKNLSFPLILRPWKEGDYLYPLGMRKKKKLARLLIDLKLSKTAKEQVWVLESNHKIVWVVGLRIDDRFKVMPSTKEVLHMQYVAS